ncbi:hypothetical protein D3C71_1948590 [compost metagenome]
MRERQGRGDLPQAHIVIQSIDADGQHLDQDFARSRCRRGDLFELDLIGVAEGSDDGCFHENLLLSCGGHHASQRNRNGRFHVTNPEVVT